MVSSYADTSFLVSIYITEVSTQRARNMVSQMTEPLPITPLLLLEFRNSLNLAILRDKRTPEGRNAIWKTFENDISDGLFFHAALSAEAINRHVLELSDRHTPKFGLRSLDLLHLAAAKSLGVKHFLTFDERQAKAAKAEGFKVRP